MTRFLEVHNEVVSASAPHVYVSALLFTPTATLLSKTYRYELSGIRATRGIPEAWSSRLEVVSSSDNICCVTFSPDRRRIALGVVDSSLRIWDTVAGREEMVFEGHEFPVEAVTFSPNGRYIASGCRGGTVRIWDAVEGVEKKVLRCGEGWEALGDDGDRDEDEDSEDEDREDSEDEDSEDEDSEDSEDTSETQEERGFLGVSSIAFSPDGCLIVAGFSDGTIRVRPIDGTPGTVLRGHSRNVTSVAFSSDGQCIFSGSNDGTIGIWDAMTGRKEKALLTEEDAPMAFSGDGRRIASGSKDGTIRVWNAAGTQEMSFSSLSSTERGITAMALSHDGRRIVSMHRHRGERKPILVVWDAVTGKAERTFESTDETDMALSRDGCRIASVHVDGTVIRLWDADLAARRTVGKGHEEKIVCMTFSPDGRYLASASEDETISIWDVTRRSVNAVIFCGDGGTAHAMAISPDGHRIVAGCDREVKIWNVASGKAEAILEGHEQPVISVAFSPDGCRIVSGSEDCSIRIWDAVGVKEEGVLRGHSGGVSFVGCSQDRRRIMSISYDRTIGIWDEATAGNATCWVGSITPCAQSTTAVAVWANTPRVVARYGDGTFKIWNSESLAEEAVLVVRNVEDDVILATVSADGRRIAIGYRGGSIRVWDVASRREEMIPKEYGDPVTCMAFAPDGCCLVCGYGDGIIEIWDVVQRKVEMLSEGSLYLLDPVAITSDGRHLVLTGYQTVIVYDTDSGRVKTTLANDRSGDPVKAAFSSDERLLAIGRPDGSITIWDVMMRTEVETLTPKRPDYAVVSLAFSLDGQKITSRSSDGVECIWSRPEAQKPCDRDLLGRTTGVLETFSMVDADQDPCDWWDSETRWLTPSTGSTLRRRIFIPRSYDIPDGIPASTLDCFAFRTWDGELVIIRFGEDHSFAV